MPAKFPYNLQVNVSGTYRVELVSPATGQPLSPPVGISLVMAANATRTGFLTAPVPPGSYAVRASRQGSTETVTAPPALNACQDCSAIWSSVSGDNLFCVGMDVVEPETGTLQASIIIN